MKFFRQKNPQIMQKELKERFITRRLAIGYSQKALADRSGVSLGSVKRFESIGKISLVSLLRIATILDCLNDFEDIANHTIASPETLKDKFKENNPQRGRRK